ncbi:class I fructose-bisphosphate aldolase [Chloroflexota bacterium]
MKGKLAKLKERIIPNGRAMILAYDQGLEHGPRDFLDNPESANFKYILDIAKRGGFTGIVLHAGLAEKYNAEIHDSNIPLILKLNGTSELYTEEDPYSPQLYLVEDALQLGATAVGYTVYSGSKYEDEMQKEFSKIIREAHSAGLPVIGWMYPRGKSLFDRRSASKTLKMALEEQEKTKLPIDQTPSIVAYGARIGMELGADIVKVKYTGSTESFRRVVQSASPTEVVMSGGQMTKTDEEFLSIVKEVIAAGAVGIAVGRNVWQRKDPLIISQKIHHIIFGSS